MRGSVAPVAMSPVVVDTNIFSRIFRPDDALRLYVESLDAVVCTVVYLELIQGEKTNAEKRKIENYIARFRLIAFTPEISLRAIELIRRYSNSHGLHLADAIIAATCLEYNCDLMTLNTRDFHFIPNLTIITV